MKKEEKAREILIHPPLKSRGAFSWIVIQKGVRVWGVGETPKRAMEEAIDYGAGKILSQDIIIRPCTLGVWELFINNDLYPEFVLRDLVERADGTVCLHEEE